MFDPQFDPLADLQMMKLEIQQLKNNEIQIAQAINQQSELIKKITLEITHLTNLLQSIEMRIRLLEDRV